MTVPFSASGARSVLRRWTVVLSIGSAVMLFAMLQIYVARAATGHAPPLWTLIRLEAPIWIFWMGASVPIVMLARVAPLDGSRSMAPALLHVLLAVTVAFSFVGFKLVWYQAFNPYPLLTPSVRQWFWQIFRDGFLDGFILYWAILGVFHAHQNYTRIRQRDLEAAAMRARLAEASLQALRIQLRPHFLFNTLNTAAAVVETDPRGARQILGRLGELLRASLHADTREEVTLAQEVELLRGFLEIEHARFGSRLVVDLQLSPETLSASIPSFLLQPVVENAVHHGVAARAGPTRLVIKSERLNGDLQIVISDDGPGLPATGVVEGIGLRNTRQRLEALYGASQSLTLDAPAAGGVHVMFRVPFRTPQGVTDRTARR
jgi:two-component system, LytTR family, sensor kinase